MSFAATYPAPSETSATARQVSGWYAAHALYLLGRAERADDDHVRALVELAGSKAETAFTLWCWHDPKSGATHDLAAQALMTGLTGGGGWVSGTCESIAAQGGYDPTKARAAGYES